MRVTRHKRQIVLFLAAILVPAGVLIGLAGRILYQDRELGAKRAIDQRAAAVGQLSRELTARLENVKLHEVNRLMSARSSTGAGISNDPAVIFTARLEGDRLIFPWEDEQAAAESRQFADYRRAGEAAELASKDYSAAVSAYRQALGSAKHPQEIAYAHLLLARTLAKAGKNEEASREYVALLNDKSQSRDEQGVGFRFYAAERLHSLQQEPEAILSFLGRELHSGQPLSTGELYLIRTLLPSFPDAHSAQLRQETAGRIGQMEQAAHLSSDLARIRAQVEASPSSAPVWVPYGEEPWLVTVASPAPPLPGLVIAVSSAKVAPPGVKLLSRLAAGDALGEAFPGLHVEWTDNRFAETGRTGLPAGIWIASVALALGIAVFGGYLLLRDVNRDVRMTEVRSQFIASVSHELKTPLTSIRIFAETLAMGRLRDERTRNEYLETIVNECERLARLVDNVLDFSKIEQGKKIYRMRTVRLEDVARSAVRAMQFPLAQQGFQLHFSAAIDLPELRADDDAIQQAILNLLTNAMKYSGDSRQIDLRLCARNGDAVIEVVDHGLGMEPEEQQHVFEKFYRAPSHESRLIAGTGLGLTLVAHIAQAHGGRVDVESAVGSGSTFSVIIPIKQVAVEVHA
jgi:signal transduction histidine kinase/tetratricopeptide (TPR) repeat protein